VPTPESQVFYAAFRQRVPNPADDYVHMRMQLMIESLAQAIERAAANDGSIHAAAIAAQLEKTEVTLAGQSARMRAADHQFQQPLAVAVMDRQGTPGTRFDVEGSGYGFRVIRQLTPQQAEQPHRCNMQRP
jgi:branched-chain amino acid transport system substrate-binding protein